MVIVARTPGKEAKPLIHRCSAKVLALNLGEGEVTTSDLGPSENQDTGK